MPVTTDEAWQKPTHEHKITSFIRTGPPVPVTARVRTTPQRSIPANKCKRIGDPTFASWSLESYPPPAVNETTTKTNPLRTNHGPRTSRRRGNHEEPKGGQWGGNGGVRGGQEGCPTWQALFCLRSFGRRFRLRF
eukprot:2990555-Pyramimonas_sp.AAC.1